MFTFEVHSVQKKIFGFNLTPHINRLSFSLCNHSLFYELFKEISNVFSFRNANQVPTHVNFKYNFKCKTTTQLVAAAVFVLQIPRHSASSQNEYCAYESESCQTVKDLESHMSSFAALLIFAEYFKLAKESTTKLPDLLIEKQLI